MQRAAVLIGVEKTGSLQRLQAVQAGVETVRAWAANQPGIGDRITILSDAQGGEVTGSDIRKAIKKYVDLTTITQLIVYFAGHGVNVRYQQYWLLSGAPEDPNEAVNVTGSVELARYCGIPHVVLISDACRTAAESIRAQNVTGSLIFPNSDTDTDPGFVDVFYAAGAGKPSLEVKDPAAAAAGFQAVYTNALVEGLGGGWPVLVEREERRDGPAVGRVRAWPLHRFLKVEVPSRLTRLGVAPGITQTPDALINSEPEAWLAQLKLRTTRGAEATFRGGPAAPSTPPPATLSSLSQEALRAALNGDAVPAEVLTGAAQMAEPGGTLLHQGLMSPLTPLGHFETQCGFKVSGTAVVEAVSQGASLELLSSAKGLVRVSGLAGPAASVLLVFADGRGALLPAIRDFITEVAYEDGELGRVVYEPSDNTSRFQDLQPQLSELRELRRVIASAARVGMFRLERREDATALFERFRALKCLDPSLAVYAAHGLSDLHQREHIAEMETYLRGNLQMSLFDVAMLAQRPAQEGEAERVMPPDVFPAIPLLSQGWAFLEAYRIALPPSLRGLQRCLGDSLWTLLKEDGVAAVRAAIQSGEIR